MAILQAKRFKQFAQQAQISVSLVLTKFTPGFLNFVLLTIRTADSERLTSHLDH